MGRRKKKDLRTFVLNYKMHGKKIFHFFMSNLHFLELQSPFEIPSTKQGFSVNRIVPLILVSECNGVQNGEIQVWNMTFFFRIVLIFSENGPL